MQLWLNWVPGLRQCWGDSYSVKTLTQQKDPKGLVHSGNCICDTCIKFLSSYIRLLHLTDYTVCLSTGWHHLLRTYILLSLQITGISSTHPSPGSCAQSTLVFCILFLHTQSHSMHVALHSFKAALQSNSDSDRVLESSNNWSLAMLPFLLQRNPYPSLSNVHTHLL